MLETERLILRSWRGSDRLPFASLNTDPRVMRFFLAPLTTAQSDAFMERIQQAFENHGFGLWAIEAKLSGAFIGFTSLSVPTFSAHFTPCVEVGWRFAYPYWGQGYATEAAKEALRFGFEQRGMAEIVSFTSKRNCASIRVMQKLGMTHDPADDFDHPRIPESHLLRPHVLYRLRGGAAV